MVHTEGADASPIHTLRSRRRPFFQSSMERKRSAKQNTMEATICAHPKRRLGPAWAPSLANTSHTRRMRLSHVTVAGLFQQTSAPPQPETLPLPHRRGGDLRGGTERIRGHRLAEVVGEKCLPTHDNGASGEGRKISEMMRSEIGRPGTFSSA